MILGKNIISVILFVIPILFLSSFVGCTGEENSFREDFAFTTLEGDIKYLSDFYGNVIVLDCMAVNCQPCMRQMFELKKISENYSKNEVSILSIDVWVSNGETLLMLQGVIDAFKSQANTTLDWTFGLDDSQGTIENTYASRGVPTLYIFDKKGNIYYSHVGYESYTELSKKIDEALIKN